MSKKIKEIHGERPKALSDEDYQAILDAEEGIFYLTKPEMSEVEKRQAAKRLVIVDSLNELDWLVEVTEEAAKKRRDELG